MKSLDRFIFECYCDEILHEYDENIYRCSCGKIVPRQRVRTHMKSKFHEKWLKEEERLEQEIIAEIEEKRRNKKPKELELEKWNNEWKDMPEKEELDSVHFAG